MRTDHKTLLLHFLLTRQGKALFTVLLLLVWLVASQHIGQMDARFFHLSWSGLKGLALYVGGDYSGAADAYWAHYGAEVRSGSVSGNEGVDAILRGDLDVAAKLSGQRIAQDPHDIYALLTLGEVALHRNEVDRARVLFREVLQYETDQFDALLMSSVAHARAGSYGESITSLNRAMRHNRVESRITSFLLALKTIGELANRPKGEQPRALLANYFRYLRIYDEHKGSTAIAYAQKAIESNDLPDQAYFALGVVYDKQGKRGKALSAYQQAITLNPRHAEAYRRAAIIHSKRGTDLADEYRMWKGAYKAASDDPFYTDAFAGFLSIRLGDFRQAITIATQMLEQHPESSDLILRVADLYKMLGEYEPALDYYRKALKLSPDKPQTYSSIGYSLDQLKRTDEAMEAFRQAVALNPRLPAPRIGIASIYSEANRHEEAIRELEEAVRYNLDESIDVQSLLCLEYYAATQYQRAANCFTQVIRRDPKNPVASQIIPYLVKNLK